MKEKDLKNALTHNRNVLKELGIVITTAQKGVFEVSLQKRKTRKRSLLEGKEIDCEVYYITDKNNVINFPVELLTLSSDRVSTKLQIVDVEYNQKGYISRVIGCFL